MLLGADEAADTNKFEQYVIFLHEFSSVIQPLVSNNFDENTYQ